MLVFIPHPNDPLTGSWREVERVPRVDPRTVRAIWWQRMKNLNLRGGLRLREAKDAAARTTASMLGLTEKTVRAFVHLDRKRQRAATGRDDGRGGTSGQPRGEQRDVGRPNANGGPTVRAGRW